MSPPSLLFNSLLNQYSNTDMIPLPMPFNNIITNKLLITPLLIKLRTSDTITVNSLHLVPTGKHGETNQPVISTVVTELLQSKTPAPWTHTDKKLFTLPTTSETDGPMLLTLKTSENERVSTWDVFKMRSHIYLRLKIIKLFFSKFRGFGVLGFWG